MDRNEELKLVKKIIIKFPILQKSVKRNGQFRKKSENKIIKTLTEKGEEEDLNDYYKWKELRKLRKSGINKAKIEEENNDKSEVKIEEQIKMEENTEEINKQKYITDNVKLYNGDCMEEMLNIKNNSVNAIITDLPYGVSKNDWDTPLDLDKMWELFKNIICKDGIIILTASGKFTGRLMMSNIEMFKYDIIWEKTINSGQLNVKRMPLRSHENILVFYNKNRTYNEQKTLGEPYKIKRKDTTGDGYGEQKESEKINDGYRHARSVIKISNPRKKGGHPTQKPVELMEYLIKTYTNEGDIVLDCCMGCGSTGIAAVKNKRKFIGIELKKEYYDVCLETITDLID